MTSLLRLIGIVCSVVSLNAVAEIYSWIDEDGKKHFGDEPPAQGARQVRKEAFELRNIDSGYPSGIVVDSDREARQPEQFKPEADVALSKREACERARKELRILSRRVIFRDEDGNEVYVSEKQRAEIERNFRATVEEHCGGE